MKILFTMQGVHPFRVMCLELVHVASRAERRQVCINANYVTVNLKL